MVWRAASSMLSEARSSCAVMSSREKAAAAEGVAEEEEAEPEGRPLTAPTPRTVLAGDALVLLLALPGGGGRGQRSGWCEGRHPVKR